MERENAARSSLLPVFLLLALQVIGIIRNYTSNYNNYFWFCDFAPVVFAFAFWVNKPHMVKGLVNIGLIAQIVYLVAFVYRLLTGVSIIELPEVLTPFYSISSLILHTSTLIAFAFTARIKPKIETLYYSLVLLMLIHAVTLIFTSPDAGINYVSKQGKLMTIVIPYYTALWVPIAFVLVALPGQLIQHIVYSWLSKRKGRMES
jgi:hypothetical protein